MLQRGEGINAGKEEKTGRTSLDIGAKKESEGSVYRTGGEDTRKGGEKRTYGRGGQGEEEEKIYALTAGRNSGWLVTNRKCALGHGGG